MNYNGQKMTKRKTISKVNNRPLSDEVYPNSPLVEVVCELRFPGEMTIECHLDKYHTKIKKKYPNILVPQVKPGIAIALEPYRFENQDKTSGVMLALNKFSYYSRKYEGHVKFIREFLRLVKLLEKVYPIGEMNRIGWRYINIIPFTREDGIVPLHSFLTLDFKLPESISNQFENLSVVFMSRVGNGSITTRLESVIKTDDGQEAFLLDFDFAMTRNLQLADVEIYVKEAHRHTRLLFEDLITDNYRQYLRGETI